MSNEEYEKNKEEIAKKLGIVTEEQKKELKELREAKVLQKIEKKSKDIKVSEKGKKVLDIIAERKELAKIEKRAEQLELVKKVGKKAIVTTGKVVKKGVTGFVSFAERLEPERPRIKYKIDVMGKRGVSIKRIDIDVEAKKRREALERKRRTIYYKHIQFIKEYKQMEEKLKCR